MIINTNTPVMSRVSALTAWNQEVMAGSVTPSVTLPTPTVNQVEKIDYIFTATTTNATFTAPSGYILCDENGFDGLSTGNSLVYTNLSVGYVYICTFRLVSANVIRLTTLATPGLKVWANMTWAEVVTACNNHTLSSVSGAVVGATKSITLNGISYPFVILGFEHDTLTNADSYGTTAHCTFQMQDCFATTHNMNDTNTNTGGWGASGMRTYLNSTMLGYMPSELQAGIKSIHKPYLATYNSGTISYCDDKLYLPSEYEIFGVGRSTSGATYQSNYVWAYNIEGTQYPYYKQATIPTGFTQIGDTGSFTGIASTTYVNRLGQTKTTSANYIYNYNACRGLVTANDTLPASSTGWWESSPNSGSGDSFCDVGSGAYAGRSYASNAYGCAPVFSL